MSEAGYTAVLTGNYFSSGLHHFRLTTPQFLEAIQLIVLRVFYYTIGMDAGCMSKSISADAGLIYGDIHIKGVAGKLGKLVCYG